MARVLMAEAEERLVALVAEAPRGDGHVVETAGGYEVIVLDVTLPGIDDLTICRRLRDAGGWAAVLLLSTRDTVADRVSGLDAGADDYLVKPFAVVELCARVRALAQTRRLVRSRTVRGRSDPRSGAA